MVIGLVAAALAGDPHLPHGPGVRWETIETRYFRVHHSVGPGLGAASTARRAARICDALLLRIAADAGFVPRGPYDLVVSDATDGMTAYSRPQEGLVVIGADPGAAVVRLRGRIDWVEDALAHELGHLVWDRRTSPFAAGAAGGVEALTTVELGGVAASLDLFAVHDLPYGLSEGLAELASEQAGVNTFDERRTGLLAAGALAGRLLTWDEWVVGADKGDVLDAERAYQQGYSFVRWLRAERGEDVLRDLADAVATRPRTSWSLVLRRVTGDDGRTLWARHRAHLLAEALAARSDRRARAAAEPTELEPWPERTGLSATDADALDHPREAEARRESTGSWELYPRSSPDGRFYAETKAGVVRIAKTDDPTRPGAPAAWLPAVTGVPVVFVPDRDAALIVTSTRPGRPGWWPAPPDRTAAVWEVDLGVDDRGELRAARRRGLRRAAHPVPGATRVRDLALGPRGELVLVRHADDQDQLWTLPLPHPGEPAPPPVRRTSFPPHTWLQSPAVSPDGQRLAVSVFRENRGELWLADLPSWRWSRVPLPVADVLDPTFTPDGALLATAAVGGAWQVVRIDPDTGALAALTDTAAGASTPAAGPDGALWLSETTADGLKSSRLAAADVSPRPLSPPPPAARAPVPTAPPLGSTRYRARPGPVAVSPLLRVDAGPPTAGSPGGPRLAGGGWVDVHDPLDTWSLSALALLGTVSGGAVDLAWSGLGPTVTASASGATTSDGASARGRLDLAVDLRWNDALTVRPGVAWLGAAGGAPLVSRRALLSLGPATRRSRFDPGPWATLDLTGARSTVGDAGPVDWLRVEGSAGLRTPLRAAVGPLDEHALLVELSAAGAATSTDVDPREEPGLGGDLWSAWRPLALEASLPFPALPPWALTGEHLAVGSARLAVPVAPRLRTAVGPLYLQGFELAPGVDLAAVAPADRVLGAVVAEARLRARWQDHAWHGGLAVAQLLGEAPPRVWLEIGGAAP